MNVDGNYKTIINLSITWLSDYSMNKEHNSNDIGWNQGNQWSKTVGLKHQEYPTF